MVAARAPMTAVPGSFSVQYIVRQAIRPSD